MRSISCARREKLVYPAQHEMEWLNEHMHEIFASSHVNMTNVFKTPGKMHGKTPKTNRKRNVAETRVVSDDDVPRLFPC
jgi:hypothetical protein